MRLILCMLFSVSSIITMGQSNYILIGTYTQTGSKGIYVYRFDEKTGKASWVSNTEGVQNPSYLAASTDGRYVYAVNETHGEKQPMVSAFSFNRNNGELKLINQRPSGGDDPCYVAISPDGLQVVAGNYSGGNVALFSVNSNGSLNVEQMIQHEGKSINEQRQEKAHVHATVFSPDGNYLFVPDLGMDKIMSYAFNPDNGIVLKPAPVPFITTEPGSGPRHLVFHPKKSIAYLMEELSGTVAVFDYDDGTLDLIERVSTHAQSFKGKIGSADIHVSPDGKHLYASNRGDQNSISIFSINKKGKLKFIHEESTLGKTPRNFFIHPSGKHLLVANQESDEVVIFSRNKKTGMLTDTGNRINVLKPVCVKMIY
ncbi:MAG: lactonase family protein [Chitinophagaceae bacterium]|nr:lactonase family protein [Chitinophagaceae bacterium]